MTLTAAAGVAGYDCRTAYDVSNGAGAFPNGKNCDVVFDLNNSSASCPACFMHRIFAEIDGDWNASGSAPSIPPAGQAIDVQGFVYWDPDSINFTGHNWSGWELHSFTAWRPSRSHLAVSMSVSPPFPGVGQVSLTALASGGTGAYSATWDFGDGTTATSLVVIHVYNAVGSVIVHEFVTDSLGASAAVAMTVLIAQSPGGSAGGHMLLQW